MDKASASKVPRAPAALAAALVAAVGLLGITATGWNNNPGFPLLAASLAIAALGVVAAEAALSRRIPQRSVRAANGPASRIAVPDTSHASAMRLLEDLAQELRTPIDTIVGFSEILASPMTAPLDEAQRDSHSRFIRDSGRTLTLFQSQLLDYARAEQGRLHLIEQDVDAAELAETAIKLCRSEIEARDVVLLAHLLDGAELRCDAGRSRQLLASLIGRAARRVPPESEIRLHIKRSSGGGLEYGLWAPCVSTSGEGQDSGFEPDFRRDGLDALALPIARWVALLHSGSLEIEAAAGSGTLIRLAFPASRVTWA